MLKKLFTATLLLVCLTVNARDNTADKENTAADNLAEKIANLRTYQADFEQRVHNETGKEIDLSTGTFSIEKPNHFRWHISQPFEQLIVADGDHIFTFDPDLEQVTIRNQSTTLADSPLLLMTSSADELANSFDISQIDVAEKADSQLFLLQAKGEGNVFESVHILFEKDDMKELLMADTLGQQTSVKFSQIKVNHKLDESLFNFVMPDGVDIVDSRERVNVSTGDNQIQSPRAKPVQAENSPIDKND